MGDKVNGKTLGITIVAVVATALSVVIGARAIVGTAATLRQSSTRSESVAPGSLETTGSEVESLLEDLAAARTSENVEGVRRDPMVPYKAPAKPSSPKQSAPARPSYKVTAVFIDADPTAVLIVNGSSIIVHVGDEVTGGRVTAIERDGVTIEGEGGNQKVAYSPSN